MLSFENSIIEVHAVLMSVISFFLESNKLVSVMPVNI